MDDDLCQLVSAMNAEGEKRGLATLRMADRDRYLVALTASMSPMRVRWSVSEPRHWVARQ